MSSRKYNDSALILRRFPYHETDLILTLLTQNYGKLRAMAKGVRQITSRRGGHLDLFNQVEIQIDRGRLTDTSRSNLGIVTEVKTLQSFDQTKQHLARLGQLYYLSELIEKLLPEEEENYLIYQTLVALFEQIEQLARATDDVVEQEIRRFEIFLLKNLGYWSDAIHGRIYPQNLDAQRSFNLSLIQEISERQLKSVGVIRQMIE